MEYTLYTPFGATLLDAKTGTYENDHKYTNKELDTDTGLYYYGARYYNATMGVFIAQDPLFVAVGTQDANAVQALIRDPHRLDSYTYSRNNPINLYDPDGNSWLSWAGNAVNTGYNFITLGAGDRAAEMGRNGVTVDGVARVIGGVAVGTACTSVAALATGITSGAAYMALVPTSTGISIGASFGTLGTAVANQPGRVTSISEHAIERMEERGVTSEMLYRTVTSPLVTLQQSGKNMLYLTREAAVVLDKFGKVVTTYSNNDFKPAVKAIIDSVTK